MLRTVTLERTNAGLQFRAGEHRSSLLTEERFAGLARLLHEAERRMADPHDSDQSAREAFVFGERGIPQNLRLLFGDVFDPVREWLQAGDEVRLCDDGWTAAELAWEQFTQVIVRPEAAGELRTAGVVTRGAPGAPVSPPSALVDGGPVRIALVVPVESSELVGGAAETAVTAELAVAHYLVALSERFREKFGNTVHFDVFPWDNGDWWKSLGKFRYHVVVIGAHGNTEAEGNSLSDRRDDGCRVSPDDVASALTLCQARVVVLRACSTSVGAGRPSMAAELVRSGVPAVLAFRSRVTPRESDYPSATLLTGLLNGDTLASSMTAMRALNRHPFGPRLTCHIAPGVAAHSMRLVQRRGRGRVDTADVVEGLRILLDTALYSSAVARPLTTEQYREEMAAVAGSPLDQAELTERWVASGVSVAELVNELKQHRDPKRARPLLVSALHRNRDRRAELRALLDELLRLDLLTYDGLPNLLNDARVDMKTTRDILHTYGIE